MSFFGVPSPNELLNTGLNALGFGSAGAKADALPKKPILSSKVQLSFISPLTGKSLDVAEFDEMSKNKIIEEKKRFKPYGATRTIVLIKDNGWELSFTGMKTDGTLNKLIYLQEQFLNGTGISAKPNKENTFESIGVLAYNPLFQISEFVTDNDKRVINYIYNDAVITGYTENAPPDNNPVTYTLNMFSPYRDEVVIGQSEVEENLKKSITDIILDMVSKAKQ